MTPDQLPALKTELTTDPVGIGYAAFGDDHFGIARKINTTPRPVPNAGDKPTSCLLGVMNVSEVQATVVQPAKAAMLQALCSMPSVDPDDKGLRAWIVAIFGQPSATLTAFTKLQKRTGSRSEELGFGRVTESDVADALMRT